MLVVLAFVKSNAPKRRPRVQISSIKDSPPPFGGRDENFPMTSQVASEKKRRRKRRNAQEKRVQKSICAPLLPRRCSNGCLAADTIYLGRCWLGYTQKLSALQLASCGFGGNIRIRNGNQSRWKPEKKKRKGLIIRITTATKEMHQQSCCTGGCIYIEKSLRVSSSVCAPGSY